MAYRISAIEDKEINFKPETEIEEILQNVWVLLNTLKFDCPLDRELGLEASFIDKPIETAKALCVADVYDTVEQYEPRAEIKEVMFKSNYETGKVYAIAEVDINVDYEEYAE